MSALTDFFLGSTRAAVQLETLEISHPNFSKRFLLVRNARKGITAKIEGGISTAFQYAPLRINSNGARNDLDRGIQVSFGDLGEVLPKEIDRVEQEDAFDINPLCIYRAYNSDDLDNILIGPHTFEIKALSQNQTGATFEAKAPGLNITKTGELYKLDRFPMLRGFL